MTALPSLNWCTITAYVLLCVGVTNLIGVVVGSLAATPVSWMRDCSFKRIVPPHVVFQIFSGVGTAVPAFILFHFLGLKAPVYIAFIAAGWDILSYFYRRFALADLTFYLAGVVGACAAVKMV